MEMKINIDEIKRNKSIKELINFGIINIDKPSGPTSFSVSNYVRKELGLSKTSHFGVLDPMVSGVLPVALSRACRLNEYLMHRNKTYVGIMRIHKEISEKVLKDEIKKFIGKIMQLPPVRSNVKREIREREVMYFNILEIQGKDVLFETEVQAGTYIRKICDDVGKNLGGAHMLELRRIKAGLFSEPSIKLEEFDSAVKAYKNGDEKSLREMLIPGEIVAELLSVIQIRKDVVKKCLTGSPIFESFIEGKIQKINEGAKVAVFSGNQFIGCYNFINKNTLIAKPEFVFN